MYTLSKLLGEKNIWIKHNLWLRIVSECVIEPQHDSQFIFLETGPKEETVVLKEDVEEIDDSSDFDVKSLIPYTLDGSEEQHWNIVDLFKNHSSVFIQNDLDLGYSAKVTHQIHTTDDVTVTFPYRQILPNQYLEVKKHI